MKRRENERAITKPSVAGSYLTKRHHHCARSRASGRSNPHSARSSRSNAELSPRRSRSACRFGDRKRTRTRLARFTLGVLGHLVVHRLTRFRLSSIHIRRRQSLYRVSIEVVFDSFTLARLAIRVPFSSTHLAQERFLEALTHDLGAGVGVLEVRHARDAPVRRCGDVRRHG